MSHQIRLRPLTIADQREPIEAGLFDDLTKSNGGDRNAGAKLAVQAAAHEVIVDTESDGGGPIRKRSMDGPEPATRTPVDVPIDGLARQSRRPRLLKRFVNGRSLP
jgi:hypothetical protein